MTDVAVLLWAFVAGAAAFFSACSFVVLPAYLAHFFGKAGTERRLMQHLARGALAGILVMLGFLAVFGVIGLGITLFGRWLAAYIPGISIGLGIGLVLFGIVMLSGKTIDVNLPAKHPKLRNNFSFLTFGIVYGTASAGCTLPVFLAVVSAAVSTDPATGFLSFISYASGMGLIMLAVSVAAAASKGAFTKRIVGLAPLMKKLSAVLIIAMGAYLVYYQLAAGRIDIFEAILNR